MKRLLAALLLPVPLLLAGCDAAAPSGSGPEAVCEREASNDPTVRHLMMLRAGNVNLPAEGESDIKYRREQVRTACLRRMGALPATHGGVEPVRRPRSAFDGLR